MRTWILAGLLGAAAVGLSSGVRPWIDALVGAFVPADIAQDVAAARLFDAGLDPYGPAIRQMHTQVLALPLDATFPYFPHPPFSLIVSWGFASVSFQSAALIWFGVTLALVFMLAALLADSFSAGRQGPGRPVGPVGAFFALLLCWPPVLYNLEKGQWSILLAVLVALGARSLALGRPGAGGAWIGAAASVKVFPVVLGGYLLLRSRRALGWFMITGVALTALPLFRIGFGAFPAFIRQSQLNLPYWETFPSVTLSIHGALARLLIGGQWADPAVHAPVLAAAIEAVVVLGLLGAATAVSLRERQGRASGPALAAWITLLPLLNPQSLGHNGVLLAIPLVMTARWLEGEPARWLKWAWALSLILVSIPRQTIWRLAPPPVGPWEGLGVVALPMWGALVLLVIAVAVAVRAPAGVGAPADPALVK